MEIKRLVLAGVIATALVGGGYALAANSNVSSESLSAGTAVTASCQSSTLTATYPSAGLSYDSSIPGYKVTTVSLTGVAAGCVGKTAKLELTGASNVSLGDSTATLVLGANTFAFASPISASAVTGVAVVVS